jgi:hypothetical protein
MWQSDEALGPELDEDIAAALEFIVEIGDTRSLAVLDDPDRESGTDRFNPIRSSTELKSPSLWRNRSPNTIPSIKVVSMARSE